MIDMLLFIIAFVIMFLAIYRILYINGIEKSIEIFLYTLSICIILLNLQAFVLMWVNSYNLRNLGILMLLVCIVLNFYNYKKKKLLSRIEIKEKKKYDSKKYNYETFIVTIFILIVIYLYMFFPTQSITAGWDAGIYINLGANISKTGGLNLYDATLNKLSQILEKSISLEYPAIYSSYLRGISNNAGELIPQFYHLLPSLFAVFYDIFGFEGLIRVNGVLGLLALGNIYYLSKRMMGKRMAFALTFLFALNPAQMWSVRSTLSETLSQFLVFLSLNLYINGIEKENTFISLIGGLILGMTNLNRIDSLIIIPALCIFCIWCLLYKENQKIHSCNFLIGFSIFAIVGTIYGVLYTYPYIYDLWINGSLKYLTYLDIFCYIFLFIFLFLYSKKNIKEKIDVLKTKFNNYESLYKLIFIYSLFALFLFGYFVRPYYANLYKVTDSLHLKSISVRAFSWYVPLIVIFFSFIGIYYLLDNKKFQKFYIFFMIALLFLGIYLYQPSISPPHPYASRRWIIIGIPFVMIMSFFAIKILTNRLEPRMGNVFIITFLILNLSFFINNDKLFLNRAMLSDYFSQYRELIVNIPQDSLVFTRNRNIASSIKYLFDRRTYLVKNYYDKEFYNLMKKYKDVYILEKDPPLLDNITLTYIDSLKLDSPWIQSYGKYPTELMRLVYKEDLYTMKLNQKNLNPNIIWKPVIEKFKTQNGIISNTSIISNGKKGFLIYGPYIDIDKGEYEICFNGQIVKNGLQEGYIDITFNNGKNVLTRKQFSYDKAQSFSMNIEFKAIEVLKNVEFRLFVNENVFLRIDSITLRKK